MTFPGPSGSSPGGIVRCVYSNALTAASHTLTFHVAWFDQEPSGAANDRLYIGGGPVTPREASILETFAALGALWAPYYSSDWSLALDSLWLNSGGTYRVLDPPPLASPVAGAGTDPPSTPKLDRIFSLLGRAARRRELWLQEVPTTIIGERLEVRPDGGGFDARDRAWMNYLSGNTGGGVVMADGTYAFPVTEIRSWWAKRPFELAGSGGSAVDGSGRLVSTCLRFLSHGASLCNDAPDEVHVNTPSGQHGLDATGITLPNSSRIEGGTNRVLPVSLPQPQVRIVDDPDLLHQEPAGDYGVCYEVATDLGWSLPSPPAHFHSDGPGSGGPFAVQVAVPDALNPIGAFSPPIVAVRFFIVQYAGYPLPAGIGGLFVEASANDWQYITPGDGIAPHTVDGTATSTMRFLHDGSTEDLELPLPVLAATPATLVGRDDVSGLPAFCPAPIPTTTTVVLGGGGGTQPAPAPECVQMRCGVSGACRDHLVSLYQDWSHMLDPLFQAAAVLGVAAAVASIPWDWTIDLGAAAGAIKGGIISLLQSFGSALTGNLLPALDRDLQNDIQRALFDHLTCVNDQVQVSADNVAAWKTALDALTTWPIASLAGPFCGLLLQYTPLAAWQAAASTASPSTACDAWP